jgi:hypothetical protein
MSDRELGEALLRLENPELAQALESRRLTREVLDRDRHRDRLVAGLTASPPSSAC